MKDNIYDHIVIMFAVYGVFYLSKNFLESINYSFNVNVDQNYNLEIIKNEKNNGTSESSISSDPSESSESSDKSIKSVKSVDSLIIINDLSYNSETSETPDKQPGTSYVIQENNLRKRRRK